MFGPLPGIKYCTAAELGVKAVFDPSPPPPPLAPVEPPPMLVWFNGVIVGVNVALLFTFVVVIAVVVVGYTFVPFRIKYC